MGHSTDKPDTSVSIKASAGIIESYDVEEHMQASELDFLQVNGIIMYRERWSHLTMVTGATPEGYFLFGGPSLPGNNIDWCGGDINSQCLAYAPTSTEVDFMIPDGSDHWVLLVPNELLLQHLDEESQATLLSHSHHLECSQESANVLIGLIQHLINKYPPNCELFNEERVCKAIEAQLLEALTQLLRPTSTLIRCKSPTKRRLAFRRAIEYAESLKQPITVPEFAAAVLQSRKSQCVGALANWAALLLNTNGCSANPLPQLSMPSGVRFPSRCWIVCSNNHAGKDGRQFYAEVKYKSSEKFSHLISFSRGRRLG
jgi:hypothetical protein